MPFTEVADRIWVARYEWFDVNVTLVAGDRGLLVVDTHASAVAAREVVADIRHLGVGEVVAVTNTHEHFDHTFGNGELRAAYGPVPIHAHETAAEQTVAAGDRIKRRYDDDPDDPHREEVLATEIVVGRPHLLLRRGARPRRPHGRAGAPRSRPHRRRPRGPRARRRRAAGR